MASDLEQAIRIVMETVGGPQAAASIRSVESAVKSASTSTTAAAKSSDGLLATLRSAAPALLTVTAATTAAAAGMRFLGDSVEAAAEEKVGIEQLGAAVRETDADWDVARSAVDAYLAAELRRVALDDGDGRTSITNLTSLTKSYTRALELMPTVLDVAAGRHISLASATELVGKVAMGNMAILSRYGITLQKGATGAEAVAELSAMYAGQAEAAVTGLEGSRQRIGVIWGNIKEDIGATLLPAVEELGVALVDALSGQEVQEAVEWVKGAIEEALSAVPGTTQYADALLDLYEQQVATGDHARQLGTGPGVAPLWAMKDTLFAGGTDEQWRRYEALVEAYQAQFADEAAVLARQWRQAWVDEQSRVLTDAEQTAEQRMSLDEQVIANLRRHAELASEYRETGYGFESVRYSFGEVTLSAAERAEAAYRLALEAVAGFELTEEQLAEVTALTTQALGEQAAAVALAGVTAGEAAQASSGLVQEMMRQRAASEQAAVASEELAYIEDLAAQAMYGAAAGARATARATVTLKDGVKSLRANTDAASGSMGVFQGTLYNVHEVAQRLKGELIQMGSVMGTIQRTAKGFSGDIDHSLSSLGGGASQVVSAWESAAQSVEDAIEGIMSPTTSFDAQGWLDENGLRSDAWDEYARRAEDVVNLGNASPWVSLLGLDGLDDEAVRREAARRIQDFYAGALPGEINWESVAQQLQEQVRSKLNWQEILAMAPEQLAQYGVSVSDADVLKAFGFDAAAGGADSASQFMDAFSETADEKATLMEGAGRTAYSKVDKGLMDAVEANGAGTMNALYQALIRKFRLPTTPPTDDDSSSSDGASGPAGDL